ncbi:MAG: circadian clock protein KaiC [Candidatus Thermoplasmatota archaeon]|nr:circadian clock protein KaiC [Candidatus Thermoplasmatota archaeon]
MGSSESAAGRDRCLTGIDGLDNILNGGLPRNNTILVTGSCGTGKTSMGLEFLLHGAEEGETGILVAATEPPEKLAENMMPYDFYDPQMLEKKLILLIDLHDLYKKAKTEGPEIDQKGSEALMKAIVETVKSHGAKRLVIDSITSICARLLTADLIREFIRGLSHALAQEECTALLIAEVPAGEDRYSPYGVEEAVVDGVILLGNLERQGDLLRTLQVVKMRGTTHSRAKYVLDLTSVGVLLAPLLKGGA